MKKELIQKIQLIPSKPGVYLFFAKGESASGGKEASGQILYVGKAINLKNRVKSHFKKNDSLIGQFKQKITSIDYIKTENETQALILEDQLIKKYQPKFNIQQKDDKSYFWVNFTSDEWPRVKITHKPQLIRHPEPSVGGEGSKKDFSRLAFDESKRATPDPRMTDDLIGPFVNGTELKKTLRAIRKILPYRTCKNSYEKPCLQWHLGLCPAHRNSSSSTVYRQSLNTLKQFLRFYAGKPLRIEAYDISNIQGTNATGSMIVFSGNKPKKSDYRKFKIKTVRGANDVAMIKEVLRRRLRHKEWPMPDLMLIDGGQAQLNSAFLEIRNSKLPARHSPEAKSMAGGEIPLLSLAKRDEELYTIYSNKTLRLSALPINLHLSFQAIRNEAHRFAISYYRKLHRKKLTFKYEKSKH